jgi:ribosomal protein RSM22 (predicted rRNA methylase)
MKKRFWKLPLNMKIEQAKLNFEDSRFSYVVLKKGERTAFTDGDMIVANPLKGKKVVYLDLCTEEGTLKRVPITKNRGTEIYRAARKAEIGDTWDNQIENSEDAYEEFDDDD